MVRVRTPSKAVSYEATFASMVTNPLASVQPSVTLNRETETDSASRMSCSKNLHEGVLMPGLHPGDSDESRASLRSAQ